MAKQNETKNQTNQARIENARVGYQVATNLWVYEGTTIWSKFNALLVANSIILAMVGLSFRPVRSSDRALNNNVVYRNPLVYILVFIDRA